MSKTRSLFLTRTNTVCATAAALACWACWATACSESGDVTNGTGGSATNATSGAGGSTAEVESSAGGSSMKTNDGNGGNGAAKPTGGGAANTPDMTEGGAANTPDTTNGGADSAAGAAGGAATDPPIVPPLDAGKCTPAPEYDDNGNLVVRELTRSESMTVTPDAIPLVKGFQQVLGKGGYTYGHTSGAPTAEMCLFPGALCAAGWVTSLDDYSGAQASVHVEVGGPHAEGTFVYGPVPPGANGIAYTLSNVPAGLRMQIEDPTSGSVVCALLSNSPTDTVPWSAFKEYCWNPQIAKPYFKTPPKELKEVAFLVPSVKDARTFDFCVTQLKFAE